MAKMLYFGFSGVLMLSYVVTSFRGVEIWPSTKDLKPKPAPRRYASSYGRSRSSYYGSGYGGGK